MAERRGLRVLYVTSVCDPAHTISASAFWWADALAARCESVDVIALDTGGTPRANMRLHSLHRSGRASAWTAMPRLAWLLKQLVPTVDVVFCQYSTKFVFAAWPFAFALRKPIVFWWSHAHVDWRLKMATRMVAAVVTSSVDSFRLVTAKKHVLGHGVDVNVFTPGPAEPPGGASQTSMKPVRIVSIGRITPVKDLETLINAAGILSAQGAPNFVLDLVGDVGRSGDAAYLARLERRVRELGLESVVTFTGPVPHDRTVNELRKADIFVNALAVGGVGRAWLEAMSVGLPTVLCTPAIDPVLDEDLRATLRFRAGDAEDLARRLRGLIEMQTSSRRAIGQRLREIVVRDHSLEHLASSLYDVLRGTCEPTDVAVAPHKVL
jgi:glycosyltransferase involved in cell wall biosynthesis